ncbi:Gx transporter family protein [Butyrivibrio sp. MC2013]|uniref:Gx transporter family protein n=1 Tax=Butyrivibrio sp. MC2013 TaxID=1280686 RepID=UPI0004206EF8|nr:Gx transporter family protein [Butyrivibrio sp. MC2013]
MNNRSVARLGLILALALILSYVESLIPFAFGIPGMKLGLPNLAVVIALYLFGWKWALTVNVLRIILSGFLFGNMFGIIYSLAGALTSFVIMLLVRRIDIFSIRGVSICGAVSHNIAQLLTAAILMETAGILYYAPFLLAAGVVTGLIIGIASEGTLRIVGRLGQ